MAWGTGQHSLGTLRSPAWLKFILSISASSPEGNTGRVFCPEQCFAAEGQMRFSSSSSAVAVVFVLPRRSHRSFVLPHRSHRSSPLPNPSARRAKADAASPKHPGEFTRREERRCVAYCCSCCSQGSHPGSGLPLGVVVPPLPVLPSSCLQGCQARELIWLRMNTDPGRIYARLKLL